MGELRWVMINPATNKLEVHCKPTATDALEYAENQLKDSEEFDCCKTDSRLEDFKNIEKLLKISK